MVRESPRAIPWHRRLEARVLVGITLVAGVALTVALVAAESTIMRHSMARSEADLAAATAVFYRLAQQRAGFAATQCRLITELPVFRASLDLGDPATLSQMAEEYRGKLGAEFCVVTDGK